MHRLLRKVHQDRSQGFTLIELLVVISIIAILSLVVVTNLTSARTKARDAKRTSDIQAIDKALELYIANSESPAAIPATTGSAGFSALVAPTGPLASSTNKYIPTNATIQDPTNVAPFQYEFKNTTTTPGTFSNFALCSTLENKDANGNSVYVDVDGSTSMQPNDSACR